MSNLIAKIFDKDGEVDLTELTKEGLHEARTQTEELLQDIENEENKEVFKK